MRKIDDAMWRLREWLAKALVSLAYKMDPEIGMNMYGCDDAKSACLAIALGNLDAKEAQQRAYAALY